MECIDCKKGSRTLNGSGRCRPCQNKIYNERQRRKDPEKFLRQRKNWHLREKYGIDLKRYEEMLREQDYKCAICKGDEVLELQYGLVKLAVDHCHKTNQVRGLLCNMCNRGLGMFKDDTKRLEEAIKYLAD